MGVAPVSRNLTANEPRFVTYPVITHAFGVGGGGGKRMDERMSGGPVEEFEKRDVHQHPHYKE